MASRGIDACLSLRRDVKALVVKEEGVLKGHSGGQQGAQVEVGVVQASIERGLQHCNRVQLLELVLELLPVLCQVEGTCAHRLRLQGSIVTAPASQAGSSLASGAPGRSHRLPSAAPNLGTEADALIPELLPDVRQIKGSDVHQTWIQGCNTTCS